MLENSYTDDELVYAVSPELIPSESSTLFLPRTQASRPARATVFTGQLSIATYPSSKGLPSSKGHPETTSHLGKIAPGPIRLMARPSGKRSMSSEGFVDNEYCLYLEDSGATHTFMSRQYCSSHGFRYVSLQANCSLANDMNIAIQGYIDVYVKLDPLQRKHRALVIDLSSFDAVLGMLFMARHDVTISC
jgi:hypothetical protein